MELGTRNSELKLKMKHYIAPKIKMQEMNADELMQLELSNAYSDQPALSREWQYDEETGDYCISTHNVWDD